MIEQLSVPETSRFPQLREILDTRRLAQVLQQHIWAAPPAADQHIRECKVKRIYYQPGEECRIIINVNIGGGVERQLYFGKIINGSNIRATFDALDQQQLAAPAFGRPIIYIPEWEMILWAYPNDPDLPGLPALVDDDKILALACQNPQNFGLAQPPAAVTSEFKKYVPGRRCAYLYHFWPAAPASGMPVTVFGKAYTAQKGAEVYRIMKQLWESEPVVRNAFRIPRPLSYDPLNRILWQEGVEGKSFFKGSRSLKQLPAAAADIGRGLAALHNTRLDLPQQMTIDFQMEAMRRTVENIETSFPHDAASCRRLTEKLLAFAPSLAPVRLTPVHGSFKFSHILPTGQGITIIDFDGINLGDPGYDMGRLIAHLYRLQATGKIPPELTELAIGNFCESYHQGAAAPLSQERINWFAAGHLVSSEIYKAIKRMYPDLVHKLLKIADRLSPAL